jgi:hypothetical protein
LPSISIPCNLYTLERHAHLNITQITENNNTSHKNMMPLVLIDNWDVEIIKELVTSDEHKEELIEALLNNNHILQQNPQKLFEFYTDGSLINRGIEGKEARMGAAWIQTKGPCSDNNFSSGVQNWPSACRAEATAILTALLTVPRKKKVTIFTDSQSCIDTYSRTSKKDPKLTHK